MLVWPLEKNEVLLWQGRPAPRCYLLRHWRSQLGALVVLLFFGPLFLGSWHRELSLLTLALFLLPLLPALVLGPLRLVYLRRRWETLFYAVTDRRLLVRYGLNKQTLSYPWLSLHAVTLHPYTDRLATIELRFTDSRRVMLECLEEPTTCLRTLPAAAINPLGQEDPV
ncbi:MAG: hypothetical protein K0A94_08420 [Desulfuromonadales bacterium]|nr:hypothetical protein [Desulfuromonadales bacterium]